MSWSLSKKGNSKTEALAAFALAVADDAHTPKDGRLENMAKAGMDAMPEEPRAPWVYQITTSGHLEKEGGTGTSYTSVGVSETTA